MGARINWTNLCSRVDVLHYRRIAPIHRRPPPNLQANTLHPVKSLPVEEGSTPVHCVEFNRVHREFLATGSGDSVKVWGLGAYFSTNALSKEEEWLDALSSGRTHIL